jgi:hypothetical protein
MEPLRLHVVLDLQEGAIFFEWTRGDDRSLVARGRLDATAFHEFRMFELDWLMELNGEKSKEHLSRWSASIRAFVVRLRKRLPVADDVVTFEMFTHCDVGPLLAGRGYALRAPAGVSMWKAIEKEIQAFASFHTALPRDAMPDQRERGRAAMRMLFLQHLKDMPGAESAHEELMPRTISPFRLRVTFNQITNLAQFEWTHAGDGRNGRVDVVHRRGMTSIQRLVTPLVALAASDASLDASSAQPVREDVRIVVASFAALR